MVEGETDGGMKLQRKDGERGWWRDRMKERFKVGQTRRQKDRMKNEWRKK